MPGPWCSDIAMSDVSAAGSEQPGDESSATIAGSPGDIKSTKSSMSAGTYIEVQVPPLKSLSKISSDYQSFPEEVFVSEIMEEVERNGFLQYKVVFRDGRIDLVSLGYLTQLTNWEHALHKFQNSVLPSKGTRTLASSMSPLNPGHPASTASPQDGTTLRKGAATPAASTRAISSSEDEDVAPVSVSPQPNHTRNLRQHNLALLSRQRKAAEEAKAIESSQDEDSSSAKKSAITRRRTRSSGIKKVHMLSYERSSRAADGSDDNIDASDLDRSSKKSRRSIQSSKRTRFHSPPDGSDFSHPQGRRSGRAKKQKNTYLEPDPNFFDEPMDIDLPELEPKKQKVVRIKETFPPLDKTNDFVRFHNRSCDTCGVRGTSSAKGILVYCQGCSNSYHEVCLGHGGAREHLVTRVSDNDYVLQCRRCIGKARIKKPSAPHLGRCTECHVVGNSCQPFRSLPSLKNAQPTGTPPRANSAISDVEIGPNRIYRSENVLFRCSYCRRAWHYNHLPPPDRDLESKFEKDVAGERLREYSLDWKCLMCRTHEIRVQTIVAWRPSEGSAKGVPTELLELNDFTEDEREYLVKFTGQSYFQVTWVPGAWLCGAYTQLHLAFLKKRPLLSLTTEGAIDETWLRIELCFDVKYTSFVPAGEDAEVDVGRIIEVEEALVKFRGLGYEEAVWEAPPSEQDSERWEEWKRAYVDYIHGQYVHLPKGQQKRAEKARSVNFERKLEKKTQPGYIKGGTLMKYQMEGLNWLYYKWWKGHNAILADEMGLGKTIQIISLLAVLFEEHKLWPFLVVVPHSTVPNWKREIQNWVPGMRVVCYHGSDTSRKLSRKYELFHPGSHDLKCHIVITSYQTPVVDSRVLRSIRWESLIVDEGQRLKNDKSQFYTELAKYNIKHKVLMTGTPLQNNPRELFNLLQFLDPKLDAKHLEEEFGELTKENVPKLHTLIRPFFLRRTKALVLTLPPMAEIIVPVSMSTVQRRLYKSILTKDTALIKSILVKHGDGKIKPTERAKLNNILMQLRKCLCHPFLYNEDIEDRNVDSQTAHRNLVEAGSKFELLNLLLPKLKEKGHRVLMFSQFLGMIDILEDFLAGLGLRYQRLDGSVSSLERQKRIDEFNAPGSELFAFLLSTRAGGVGINLATADTVIILDPDFNPHQDIQALSRAHRIGQTKKVQVFHLITRDTAEEKIVQIGKKKLSLDHLIIEKMDTENEEEVDVESILKFGARALFEDDGGASDARRIRYDNESLDKLLDRSAIEQTLPTGEDGNKDSEDAFSFARVWANDKAMLEEGLGDGGEGDTGDGDLGFWDRVLKEREEEAKRQAELEDQELGRGRRKKKVNYNMDFELSPKKSGDGGQASSDTDFRASPEHESESELDGEGHHHIDPSEILLDIMPKPGSQGKPKINAGSPQLPMHLPVRGPRLSYQSAGASRPSFPSAPPHYLSDTPRAGLNLGPPTNRPHSISPASAAPVAPVAPMLHTFDTATGNVIQSPHQRCKACGTAHRAGHCRLRAVKVQLCPLCGVAHHGDGGVCPHLRSETQINSLMTAINQSPEDPKLIADARQLLRERKREIKLQKKITAMAMKALAPSVRTSVDEG